MGGGAVAGRLLENLGVAGQGIGIVLDAAVLSLRSSVAFVRPSDRAGVVGAFEARQSLHPARKGTAAAITVCTRQCKWCSGRDLGGAYRAPEQGHRLWPSALYLEYCSRLTRLSSCIPGDTSSTATVVLLAEEMFTALDTDR